MSKGRNLSKLEISETGGIAADALTSILDAAPEQLNTLNELAAALGDDANFATTVTNSLATKADLSGANFTGNITTTGDIGLDYELSIGNGTNGYTYLTQSEFGFDINNGSGNTTSIISAGDLYLQANLGNGSVDVVGNIKINNGAYISLNGGDTFTDSYGETVPHHGLGSNTNGHPLTVSGYHGLSLVTVGQERVKIDNSGYVTMPNQPIFDGELAGGSNWAAGSIIGIGTHNAVGITNNGNTLTVPVAGKYMVMASQLAQPNTGGTYTQEYAYFSIYQNGVQQHHAHNNFASVSNKDFVAISLLNCGANDTINIRWASVGVGYSWGGSHSRICVYKVS